MVISVAKLCSILATIFYFFFSPLAVATGECSNLITQAELLTLIVSYTVQNSVYYGVPESAFYVEGLLGRTQSELVIMVARSNY